MRKTSAGFKILLVGVCLPPLACMLMALMWGLSQPEMRLCEVLWSMQDQLKEKTWFQTPVWLPQHWTYARGMKTSAWEILQSKMSSCISLFCFRSGRSHSAVLVISGHYSHTSQPKPKQRPTRSWQRTTGFPVCRVIYLHTVRTSSVDNTGVTFKIIIDICELF